jgi:hypothetical protein
MMCYVTTTFTGSRMHNLTFFFNGVNNIFQHRNIHSELLIHSSLLAMICRRSSISTTGALKIECMATKRSHMGSVARLGVF